MTLQEFLTPVLLEAAEESRGEPGHRGPEGLDGNPGVSSIPDVKQLNFKELWKKIIIELGIPSG